MGLVGLVPYTSSACVFGWFGNNHGYRLCLAIPGVDPVVSHESRHFADHGQELLLHVPRHLFRVGHTLVAPYRSVHSFCTTSFALRSIPLTTIAGISGVGKSPSLTLW